SDSRGDEEVAAGSGAGGGRVLGGLAGRWHAPRRVEFKPVAAACVQQVQVEDAALGNIQPEKLGLPVAHEITAEGGASDKGRLAAFLQPEAVGKIKNVASAGRREGVGAVGGQRERIRISGQVFENHHVTRAFQREGGTAGVLL